LGYSLIKTMNDKIQNQVLAWKEELKRQIINKDQAQKTFDEAVVNINALQGGIQFGENLLKKIESTDQPSNTVEPTQQSKKAPSKK